MAAQIRDDHHLPAFRISAPSSPTFTRPVSAALADTPPFLVAGGQSGDELTRSLPSLFSGHRGPLMPIAPEPRLRGARRTGCSNPIWCSNSQPFGLPAALLPEVTREPQPARPDSRFALGPIGIPPSWRPTTRLDVQAGGLQGASTRPWSIAEGRLVGPRPVGWRSMTRGSGCR